MTQHAHRPMEQSKISVSDSNISRQSKALTPGMPQP